MKLSLEKEKASLKEEKSYNLRLLEMNEKKEKEMLQLTQRHGKKKLNPWILDRCFVFLCL